MKTTVRVSVALVVAAAAAAVLAVPGGAANECRGIPVCISVPGPWVYVPAKGSATYLLECPRRRGVVGGVDALASSRDVHVTFEGRLGSPVSPGTTTGRDAYFTAFSDRRRDGSFQPFLGCIPAGGGGGGRSTTTARVTRPGLPVERRARNVKLGRGAVQTVTVGCARGERLVSGWHALAFRTRTTPDVSFAEFIRITRTIRNGKVVARILSSEGVPSALHAEAQVGAVCAT
jgi:hypothetical protein